MSKPTLTYFSGRGRAEGSRLILAEAGVEYVDNRVTDHSSLKPKLPFGQLPHLEDGDLHLVQSITIARYLARKYNLAGKDLKEQAQADMIVDGVLDINAARNAAKTEEEKQKLASEVLPKWLGYFEELLKKNGGKFFVGDNVTWADLYVYNALDVVVSMVPKALDSFSTLKSFKDSIANRPRIAAWLVKRPVTSF